MKDVHIHFQYISSVQNHDLYFLLLKGCPNVEDAPSLVAPCADKIDLEHLSRDLPKYKPWLSNESRKEWEASSRCEQMGSTKTFDSYGHGLHYGNKSAHFEIIIP